MVYRCPKATKTSYTEQVTGPWFDSSVYTNDSLPSAEAANISANGDSSVLKNQLVHYWSRLNIQKVVQLV